MITVYLYKGILKLLLLVCLVASLYAPHCHCHIVFTFVKEKFPMSSLRRMVLSLIHGGYFLLLCTYSQILVRKSTLWSYSMESPLFQAIVHTWLTLTLMAVFSFPLGNLLAPRRENLHCSVIPLCWSVGHQSGLLQWVHKYLIWNTWYTSVIMVWGYFLTLAFHLMLL